MLFQRAIAAVHVSEYFEHGQVVCDVTKLRERYVSSTAFKLDMVSQLDVVSQLDMVSVLPTDLVFLVSYDSYTVVARLNRVLRID